ncbi:MAG: DUF1269 domain-containing protein [Chloroflexaceae bacterium]|nr:DUF1269 domain-containing protein [Chloroflexaceae bacterium]
MSTLVVLGFKTEDGAKSMLGAIQDLQKRELITLLDAAILTRKSDGKPKIKQLHDLVGAGALGGAFWGLLIGLLFWMPWLGLAAGMAGGALGGMFSDIGIDDDFIKGARDKIEPGTSALFLLTSNAVVDKVVEELKSYEFEILQTNLSTENEAKLREAFGAPEGMENATAE